jgi:hypothetical protein
VEETEVDEKHRFENEIIFTVFTHNVIEERTLSFFLRRTSINLPNLESSIIKRCRKIIAVGREGDLTTNRVKSERQAQKKLKSK